MAWGNGAAAWVDRFAVARAMWADDATALTDQGFIKAWLRTGRGLAYRIEAALRQRLIDVAGVHARRFGFFVLAADGSRFALPRTGAHERVFGLCGKKCLSPQMYVTMLWHLGVGMGVGLADRPRQRQ